MKQTTIVKEISRKQIEKMLLGHRGRSQGLSVHFRLEDSGDGWPKLVSAVIMKTKTRARPRS
jgi:hypothetical protein